jgi:hypothetical protein
MQRDLELETRNLKRETRNCLTSAGHALRDIQSLRRPTNSSADFCMCCAIIPKSPAVHMDFINRFTSSICATPTSRRLR